MSNCHMCLLPSGPCDCHAQPRRTIQQLGARSVACRFKKASRPPSMQGDGLHAHDGATPRHDSEELFLWEYCTETALWSA